MGACDLLYTILFLLLIATIASGVIAGVYAVQAHNPMVFAIPAGTMLSSLATYMLMRVLRCEELIMLEAMREALREAKKEKRGD